LPFFQKKPVTPRPCGFEWWLRSKPLARKVVGVFIFPITSTRNIESGKHPLSIPLRPIQPFSLEKQLIHGLKLIQLTFSEKSKYLYHAFSPDTEIFCFQ
jgi:hypothetical protein